MLFINLLFLLLLLVIRCDLGKAANITKLCLKDNFYQQPVESCPPPTSTCHCKTFTECPGVMLCCNVTSFIFIEGIRCGRAENNATINNLQIRNATMEILNLNSYSNLLIGLDYLSITDGNITNIKGYFAKNTKITFLNFSSNGIKEFDSRSLSNLFKLEYLDLSDNKLVNIPPFKKDGLIRLDISGNPSIYCKSVIENLNRTNLEFIKENNTFCSSDAIFDDVWFNNVEIISLTTCKEWHKVTVENNCFKNCTCTTKILKYPATTTVDVYVSLSCAGQEFLSLPTPLPAKTFSLNVSNNNITTLKGLNDPSYQYLKFLYADNNQISSIQPLEGSKFITDFDHLSLKNNSFKTFETYVLSNIEFDRSTQRQQLNISGNSVYCDCQTAKDLKVWLLSKSSHIGDYNEVRCENLNQKVIELNTSKLCVNSQQDWTDYIYYIITAEVVMLVCLVAKVTYDYWVFKTAGYLPWPANKMPKLPCDWLCE
ncbi:unnamed protein product [Brassicogethes aeneus]|uniref:Protein halfway n=1 Tax=Brassicogethes aeneus TaxID=1431903 RepID=A0A9P0ATM8_BRAAE|nr:unnamed protein product [Brassicogethes aeneus]